MSHHATSEESSELPLFVDLEATERAAIGRALSAVTAAVDGDSPIPYGPFARMLQDATRWLEDEVI